MSDKRAAPPKKNFVRRFFSVLGPGLITGAADDDPSGIATYSIAGAQMGTANAPIALGSPRALVESAWTQSATEGALHHAVVRGVRLVSRSSAPATGVVVLEKR